MHKNSFSYTFTERIYLDYAFSSFGLEVGCYGVRH